MLKKLMEKYYQFGFKKVLDEYKNYSKDEKAYAWFVINQKTLKNFLLIAPNNKLSNFRLFRIWKIMIIFLLLIILISYFLDGKIFFVSIFLIMFVVQIVSDKQDLYLQRRFKNIDDELEKKHRACNLYLKDK
ncbi:hypothetical protein N5U17_11330 [Aliarcobacter butzleri]|uniref:Uncharacterized protein n=1 Tax=Aliarcobacter butzleri L348 TaxID=1447256 RepID=A0A0G9K659_9BACT|nr:hypothetical protein [Aliarcobacter butzleri]KLE02037.1 hypothetical protein AA20_01635 [Aliarcobacter butzleri L348]MCT7591537.1 hypothetical protein [Aliarcobacter butzleri]MCT7604821.1 hypothetical protein [Aliarcobacter butzleri]NUW26974.1 hypothetical protein [Aliarcobacter butzleri]PZQ08895.1 MAG: hypothetical protein DI567_01555 [Aliarcobacter butzleri]